VCDEQSVLLLDCLFSRCKRGKIVTPGKATRNQVMRGLEGVAVERLSFGVSHGALLTPRDIKKVILVSSWAFIFTERSRESLTAGLFSFWD